MLFSLQDSPVVKLVFFMFALANYANFYYWTLGYINTKEDESNPTISLSNSSYFIPPKPFLKTNKQKCPSLIDLIFLLITENPRLRHLFLETAVLQTFFDTENENLALLWSVLATYKRR